MNFIKRYSYQTDNKCRKLNVTHIQLLFLELCNLFRFIQISTLQEASKTQEKSVFVCGLFYFHHCNGGSRIKRKRGEGERLFALLQLLRSQHSSFSLQHSLQRKYTNLLHINCTLTLHLLKFSVLI